MTHDLFLALFAFAFVTSVTPGPNNLMLMTSGANFGLRRTLPHMSGVSFGFVFMCVIIGAGLVQVFTIFPPAQTLLKVASVVFLTWLAWKIANSAPLSKKKAAAGTPMTFLQASAFQWVNPKAWSMGVTAIAAYRPEESGMWGVVMVAVIFGLINFPSVSIWVLLGTQLRRILDVDWKLRAFNLTAAALLLASLYPILKTEI